MTDGEPLLELLARCVVRVDVGGGFSGTGFFVAPGEVLTCAHVVHGGRPITVFDADGRDYPAEPMTGLLAADDPQAQFYPQPDAALLRVAGAPDDQPCVRLEAADPAIGTDVLQLVGFTRGENAPDAIARSGATLHLETLFEPDGCTLYKLREGQVIGGFSGSPLLNLRTGGVCAIVDSSRSLTSALGGFGVPIAAVAGIDAGLLTRNTAFHQIDDPHRWARAVEEQAQLAAERAGDRDLLPPLAPVLDLDWDPDNVAPSELLRPKHAVVPFVPRGHLLEQVMRWRESDERLQVLVLTGAGGFGKTRTAVEICRAAEDAGWTAGPVDADTDWVDGLTELLRWPGRTVLAIDYAETRPDLVKGLLTRLLRRRAGPPCRVVLVVRQVGDRQSLIDLFATGDSRAELARLLRRAELVGLGRGERELDRRELFTTAGDAFAERLGGAGPKTVPGLSAEHFERPLFVLAAALLAVTSPDLDVAALSADELLGEILDRHEAEYWRRADERHHLGLQPEDRRTAVALAALCGLSSDQDDERLIRLVWHLRDASAERVGNVVEWLRALYGPHGSLEPDLLAEVLVARAISKSPGLVGTVLDAASDGQLTRTLLVLSRVTGRSEPVYVAVRDALDERLTQLALRAAEGHTDLVTALRLAIAEAHPVTGAVNAQHRIPVRGAAIRLLAVEIGELAVNGLRTTAESNPETHRPPLAAALKGLATTLTDTGRPAEGLPPIEEAVTIYRDLAAADPTRFLPDLAGSLRRWAGLLAEGGEVEAAAELFDRALAEHAPSGWRRGVVLLERARWHSGAGWIVRAVADVAEAVALLNAAGDRWRRGQARQAFRSLAAEHPAAVDQAWPMTDGSPPVWLRVPQTDVTAGNLIIDWVDMKSWEESFDFLADHISTLLTDEAEAAIEHLIDANPGRTALDLHLDILRGTRATGVDAVRGEFFAWLAAQGQLARLQQWINTPGGSASADYLNEHADELLTGQAESLLASLVPDQPHLLGYLGLLSLARAIGVEDTHHVLVDRTARDTATAAEPPAHQLPLARLAAGVDPGSAEPQFAYALAALETGAETESVWAMTRCRDACATWERPAFTSRLDDFAQAHPELDLTSVRRTLIAEDDA